jgi:large subunit ribosomal protein L24
MRKFHVKRGDQVVVLAGTEKGKQGKILRVLPDKQRVIVEGLKIIKKHLRKNQQYPQGAIIKREGSIHVSNVMRVSVAEARAARRSGSPSAA